MVVVVVVVVVVVAVVVVVVVEDVVVVGVGVALAVAVLIMYPAGLSLRDFARLGTTSFPLVGPLSQERGRCRKEGNPNRTEMGPITRPLCMYTLVGGEAT